MTVYGVCSSEQSLGHRVSSNNHVQQNWHQEQVAQMEDGSFMPKPDPQEGADGAGFGASAGAGAGVGVGAGVGLVVVGVVVEGWVDADS
jgi:hypothetical protein